MSHFVGGFQHIIIFSDQHPLALPEDRIRSFSLREEASRKPPFVPDRSGLWVHPPQGHGQGLIRAVRCIVEVDNAGRDQRCEAGMTSILGDPESSEEALKTEYELPTQISSAP